MVDKYALRDEVNSYPPRGDWKTVTIDKNAADTAEIDLDDEYSHVEIKFGVVTSVDFTFKKTEESGGEMVLVGPTTNDMASRGYAHYDLFDIHSGRYIQMCGSGNQGQLTTISVRGINRF